MIWFVPRERQFRIYISKAVSEDEVNLILNSDDVRLRCFDINRIYWACETRDDRPGESVNIYLRCRMLGWEMQGASHCGTAFVPSPGCGPFILVRK